MAIGYVTKYETSLTATTSPKTVSVTVATDDWIVVSAVATEPSIRLSDPSGGGLVYTARESIFGITGRPELWQWTAPSLSAQTFTCSMSRTAGVTGWGWGFSVQRFTGVGGVGTTVKGNAADTAPSVNITTTAANSAIVMAVADDEGPVVTSVYRTNAGAYTEITAVRDTFNTNTVWFGHHINAGPVNTYAIGMTTPTAPDYGLVAVELVPVSLTKAAPPFRRCSPGALIQF